MKSAVRALGWPLLALGLSTLLIGHLLTTLWPLVSGFRFGGQPAPEVTWLVPRVQAGWVLAHALVGLFWRRTAPDHRTAQRRFQRLAWASLALSIGLLVPLRSWYFIRPLARGRLFFLTYTTLLVMALWWLFQHRTLRFHIKPGLPASLAALTGASLLTVMLGESTIDFFMSLSMNYVPDFGTWSDVFTALALNSILLLAVSALFLAITGRRLFAVLSTAVLFAFLVLADIQKLLHLRTPLSVLDTHYLGELNSVLTDFFSTEQLALVAAAGVLAAVGLGVLFRRTAAPTERLRLLGASLALLAGSTLGLIAWNEASHPESTWEARAASLSRGLALDLLIGAINSSPKEPPNYSRATIQRIREQRLQPTEPALVPALPPNLILLAVESLTDPLDFGFELSEDPLVFLRSLESEARFGRSLSPSFGSQSANAEFELLTGMSMGFLPNGSLPYRQYLHRKTPSLASMLGDLGYHTKALIVDPRTYFERPTALPLLGFEDIEWLDERPDLARDVTDRYASDEAVVDELIAMDRGKAPFFAFAFTNASHAPFAPEPFGPSAVRVLDAPNARVRNDLGGYASAVRAVDRAVRRLVAHFRSSQRPTLIVIVGDHMPPFASPAGVYEESHFFSSAKGPLQHRYTTPIWMWANYDIGTEPLSLAHNFVGVTALEAMGIEPEGLLQLVEQVHMQYRSLSQVVEPIGAAPRPIDILRERKDPIVRDYELLQYDLLNGEQFATE